MWEYTVLKISTWEKRALEKQNRKREKRATLNIHNIYIGRFERPYYITLLWVSWYFSIKSIYSEQSYFFQVIKKIYFKIISNHNT